MTTSVDQKLGQDAFARFKGLRNQLNSFRDQWEQLQQTTTIDFSGN